MTDVTLPGMGESIAEGTVSVWIVDVGGYVEADQPLVTVSTDKADVDVPSPVSGVLTEVIVAAGETVAIGTLIARIDETAAKGSAAGKAKKAKKAEKKEKAPSEPLAAPEGVPGAEAGPKAEPEKPMEAPPEIKREVPEEEPEETDRSGFYSPAVMRAAIEQGVDLKSVKGTGEGGRVTKADVMKAAGARPEAPAKAPPEPPEKAPHEAPPEAPEKAPVPKAPPGRPKDSAAATSYGHVYVAPETPTEAAPGAPAKAAPKAAKGAPAPAASGAAEGFGAYRVPVYEVEEGDKLQPFTRLRRIIADHMVYSRNTAAHVTTFAEADLENVYHLREKHKARLKKEGVGLTYLHFVMMATIRALFEYPLMNSVVQEDRILTKKSVNMGVAVDTERGLMVPVIREAGSLGLVELARKVNDISERVRDKKAAPGELTGGTFTVSNPGRKGNLFGTPIISQPQVGILRMGELVKKPVVVDVDGDDAIVVHPMMYLSLSYDHRVVDGLTSNEFLHRIREHLEEGAFEL